MMFRLVPLIALPNDRAVEVRGPRFSIGRADDCSLRVNNPYVSWNHCELLPKPDGLLVHDMASRNGTFVNFDRVSGDTLLQEGDILGVATTCYRVDRRDQSATFLERLASKCRTWLDQLLPR